VSQTLSTEQRLEARVIAREEIASLAALAMRRLQEDHFTRSNERNLAAEVAKGLLASFWGEVLNDFGKTDSEPGP